MKFKTKKTRIYTGLTRDFTVGQRGVFYFMTFCFGGGNLNAEGTKSLYCREKAQKGPVVSEPVLSVVERVEP